MSNLIIEFNGNNYITKYNEQSGYYELELQAPNENGGIYQANIIYKDLLEQEYKETRAIQVLAKQKRKYRSEKCFAWFFDRTTFKVKDIIELLDDYVIARDEETNINSIVRIAKENDLQKNDFIAIKKDNEVVYWGIIDNINNQAGEKIYELSCKYIINLFNREVDLLEENLIKEVGIEDFILRTIERHFSKNSDKYVNKNFLDVVATTHYKLNKKVDNVQNDIFILTTFMINCTQNYNIIYDIKIRNKRLLIDIHKAEKTKEIISYKAGDITNYEEIFDTNVIAKVKVKTKNEGDYLLFLKTDRTTTENQNDSNRAYGDIKILYAETKEEAKQLALDTIKQNSYKHYITFYCKYEMDVRYTNCNKN